MKVLTIHLTNLEAEMIQQAGFLKGLTIEGLIEHLCGSYCCSMEMKRLIGARLREQPCLGRNDVLITSSHRSAES